jgi:hypothetical protein
MLNGYSKVYVISRVALKESIFIQHRHTSSAIDHRTWKTGLPVRSVVLKPCAGRLVVGWVTTSEYLLSIVLLFAVDGIVCSGRRELAVNYRCFKARCVLLARQSEMKVAANADILCTAPTSSLLFGTLSRGRHSYRWKQTCLLGLEMIE